MLRLLITYFFSSFLMMSAAWSQDLHYVEIGVNGLHCSACSFTVEKALKKIESVSVVQMDLNERSGKIYFEDKGQANFVALAKAIKDAGYSVRFLKLQFREPVELSSTCQLYNYCFVGQSKSTSTVQLFGAAFLPKKEWKAMQSESLQWSCADCKSETYLAISKL